MQGYIVSVFSNRVTFSKIRNLNFNRQSKFYWIDEPLCQKRIMQEVPAVVRGVVPPWRGGRLRGCSFLSGNAEHQ